MLSDPADPVVDSLEGVTDALAERGWCVARGLLDPTVLKGLALDAEAGFDGQGFHPAAIGKNTQKRVDRQRRRDQVQWLDPGNPSAVQRAYWDFIESLRVRLNRDLYLGVREFEAQFSAYPPGASYARHIDQFHRDDARAVTCVAYLNRDWRADDGGQLRLYLGDGLDHETPVDIRPELGTLIVFMSDRFFHEVLPAARLRLAVSGWFRRFDPLS